jgi:hypothetical protein
VSTYGRFWVSPEANQSRFSGSALESTSSDGHFFEKAHLPWARQAPFQTVHSVSRFLSLSKSPQPSFTSQSRFASRLRMA